VKPYVSGDVNGGLGQPFVHRSVLGLDVGARLTSSTGEELAIVSSFQKPMPNTVLQTQAKRGSLVESAPQMCIFISLQPTPPGSIRLRFGLVS
jgi:hypothetical protein